MRLRDARKAAGLTQTQLAERVSVDYRLISRLETGHVKSPSHRAVVRICRVLGVDPQTVDEFHVPEAE